MGKVMRCHLRSRSSNCRHLLSRTLCVWILLYENILPIVLQQLRPTHFIQSTTDTQGNEGTYENFDYVLTVEAGEISDTGTLTGIGYNPIVTVIVITNDGGKILVGYGMKTLM